MANKNESEMLFLNNIMIQRFITCILKMRYTYINTMKRYSLFSIKKYVQHAMRPFLI